jgi:hypothetical protein
VTQSAVKHPRYNGPVLLKSTTNARSSPQENNSKLSYKLAIGKRADSQALTSKEMLVQTKQKCSKCTAAAPTPLNLAGKADPTANIHKERRLENPAAFTKVVSALI